MTTTSRFEYECLLPPPYGIPGWRRTRFIHRRHLGLEADPAGDEEALAHEILLVISHRYRTGTKFRLVRVTEEVFDAPEHEVTSPEPDLTSGRK